MNSPIRLTNIMTLHFGGLLLLITYTVNTAYAEATNPKYDSPFLEGERNYLTGYPAVTGQNLIHVVIEIPAGTIQKWEVSADGKTIHWEKQDDGFRIIDFLAYPGNYGMVPRTVLSKPAGGDGDPLDVLLLGPALPRGSVVMSRPIGILMLLDSGEQDDKIISVPIEGPFSQLRNLEDLEREYPGAKSIIEDWFVHYKGDAIVSGGFANADEAYRLISDAAAEFESLTRQ